MAESRRGLLLLFEGIPTTVIHSQVGSLVSWLAREGIMALDIVTFACTREGFAAARSRLAELRYAIPSANVTLLRGVRPALPGSLRFHRWLLSSFLRAQRGRYVLIHARTDYAAEVAGKIAARERLDLIWDCRGDAMAEFEQRARLGGWPEWLLRIRAARLLRGASMAAKQCTRSIFVTPQLAGRWQEFLSGKPCYVIPCLADRRRFFPAEDLRARTRARLGFADSDEVYVYSGSLADYQGFDLVVQYFRRVRSGNSRSRLLIVTPQLALARERIVEIEAGACQVTTARFEEMPALLNAADFAFLIRPGSPINTAAFATKFAEFGLVGLRVITDDNVPSCADYARRIGNFIDATDPDPPIPASYPERVSIAERTAELLTHESFRETYREIYNV